ncbi:hypothetical protein [Planococcus beigongshangi]|nr:hypothetical protein [Planococcus beigongshangi]
MTIVVITFSALFHFYNLFRVILILVNSVSMCTPECLFHLFSMLDTV